MLDENTELQLGNRTAQWDKEEPNELRAQDQSHDDEDEDLQKDAKVRPGFERGFCGLLTDEWKAKVQVLSHKNDH